MVRAIPHSGWTLRKAQEVQGILISGQKGLIF
jgi:hypothetical protein